MFVTFLGFLGDYAPLSFDSTGIVATPEDWHHVVNFLLDNDNIDFQYFGETRSFLRCVSEIQCWQTSSCNNLIL
jgi:hypothetical protein